MSNIGDAVVVVAVVAAFGCEDAEVALEDFELLSSECV